MMKNRMKIKQIYNCSYIVSDEALYPLQKWYNQLIDKSVNEINIADVLKMIRQKEFIDIAVSKAIEFLQYDPFIGELYKGELLEKIANIDILYLTPYLQDLKNILKNVLKENKTHEWLYGEKEEIEKIAYSLLKIDLFRNLKKYDIFIAKRN